MTTEARTHTGALVVLTSLFFMWGLITSLNDILIPHLRAAFELTYVQAMLIQFCFFGAYFVMSLPSGVLVERVGYKAGIVFGLLMASAGCLLFYPAAGARSYPFFLGALFVLASGITLLQVAANPYVAILGPQKTASSRLNLTQAFNSLGTTVGPVLGTSLILAAPAVAGDGGVRAAAEASAVQGPYLGLAAMLCLIALVVGLVALPRITAAGSGDSSGMAGREPGSVWSYRPLVLGAIAIFLYVGAEVSIGSFFVNFVEQPQIAGLPAAVAGAYLSLYWGGAMIGRFVGSFVLRYREPGSILAFNALAAAVLLAVAMVTTGPSAMWAIIAIGLFNSIMFPTIFTLAIEGLGPRTGEGSGVLCMAIVGGAIVPVAMGWLADHTSLLYSFALPLVCYLYIAYYGSKGSRLVPHALHESPGLAAEG
jgi:FHS family L-fucose permease-like MFS transporter